MSYNTQKSRWMALMSAIDLIESSCKKYKKDFNTIDIKPSALKKFIDTMAAKYEKEIWNDDKKDMNQKVFIDSLTKRFACNEQKS